MPNSTFNSIHQHAIEQVELFFNDPERAFAKLAENIPERGTPIDNVAAWRGEIDCGGTNQQVTVALDRFFPDTLPNIYLSSSREVLPHITRRRQCHVCTTGTEGLFINSGEPVKIVLESLAIASKVITGGLNGDNEEDFSKEFYSYWGDEIPVAREFWISLFEVDDNPRIIKVIEFKPDIGGVKYLAVKNVEQGQRWLKNISRETIEIISAIYLPLKEPLSPPFPKTNSELYQVVKKNCGKSAEALSQFVGKTKMPFIRVLFSFPFKGKYVSAGWVLSRTNLSKRVMTKKIPGFRKNNIPGHIQLTHFWRNSEIFKVKIEQADAKRLQERVGNSMSEILAKKNVTIVGCGSVGGNLALILALSGISKMVLVDNDAFALENIPRHICPISSIGIPKPEAVKIELVNRLPHIDVVEKNCDCYSIISDKISSLSETDLIICATGEWNLNLRLNQLQQEGLIETPILYVWLEAFGVAAHAVIITPNKGGCLQCLLDTNYDYKYRALKNTSDDLTLQEAGCNSTFTPFGAIDAACAANVSARLVVSYFHGKIKSGEKWVYLGDTEQATDLNLDVATRYLSAGSYKTIRTSVGKSRSCLICGSLINAF